MSRAAGTSRPFGEGALARAAALVYTLIVIEGLLILTTAPSLLALILLDRDASNIPLAAVCVLPVGPAVSAALYALARRRPDLTDLKPASAFWRGYKLNIGAALRIWTPFLLLLTVIGVTLTHLDAAGVPTWWAVSLGLVAALASLWVANALVITSLFAFRAVDVARLAAYFLLHRVSVTFGTVCLLLAAAGVTAVSSEAVLVLFASSIAALLLLASRPMTAEVEEKFTA